ncbi:MAG: hypothetical protein KKC51_13240 [Verrucomicrobia bacterium]|nr:hypothetical protein [Verrucomicrobiota bacterium]
MKVRWRLLVLLPALTGSVRAAVPARWISRGPGGGGALFGPAISPHHPETIYADCDMSGRYRSRDMGRSWETLSFLQVQGGTLEEKGSGVFLAAATRRRRSVATL